MLFHSNRTGIYRKKGKDEVMEDKPTTLSEALALLDTASEVASECCYGVMEYVWNQGLEADPDTDKRVLEHLRSITAHRLGEMFQAMYVCEDISGQTVEDKEDKSGE